MILSLLHNSAAYKLRSLVSFISQTYALPRNDSVLTTSEGQWQAPSSVGTSGNADSIKLVVNEQSNAIAVWSEHTVNDTNSTLITTSTIAGKRQRLSKPCLVQPVCENSPSTLMVNDTVLATWLNKNSNNQYELYASQ